MNTVLITGANGEVGHALIKKLHNNDTSIVAVDIVDLDHDLLSFVSTSIKMDITDKEAVQRVVSEQAPNVIFHLAARLSTLAEKDPIRAHEVNVNGTAYLLESATQLSLTSKSSVKFIYPSTIAVYGLNSNEEKTAHPKVLENEFQNPITMYGINKLYGESLGKYYSEFYNLIGDVDRSKLIDFRCVRFPGLISAETLPTGGTSDYASEMIHAAAQGKHYSCFVREDTKIPFMAMPDAVSALVDLSQAEKQNLTQKIYNISGFSLSAGEIFEKTKSFYSNASISYDLNPERQKIVDSWPEDCNDQKAISDWNYKTIFTSDTIFSEYLVPAINKRYMANTTS